LVLHAEQLAKGIPRACISATITLSEYHNDGKQATRSIYTYGLAALVTTEATVERNVPGTVPAELHGPPVDSVFYLPPPVPRDDVAFEELFSAFRAGRGLTTELRLRYAAHARLQPDKVEFVNVDQVLEERASVEVEDPSAMSGEDDLSAADEEPDSHHGEHVKESLGV